jgi:hypothetical protein
MISQLGAICSSWAELFKHKVFHRRLCAGKFRDLKYDFNGGNRELLDSTAVLATVLQFLTPFLACLVLFSFASATLLKACSILTHANFSKAVQGHSGTLWAQVCFCGCMPSLSPCIF